MKIGDTVYKFDINYRVYDKPGMNGRVIYREHFRPRRIVGETKFSWLTDRDEKIKKKAPTPLERGGFYSAEEVEDDVWRNFTSREVAEILICHLKAKDIPAPAYVGNTDTGTWEINDDGSVRVEWS